MYVCMYVQYIHVQYSTNTKRHTVRHETPLMRVQYVVVPFIAVSNIKSWIGKSIKRYVKRRAQMEMTIFCEKLLDHLLMKFVH